MITTELDRYEFTAATSTISNPVVFRSSGTDVPIQNASDIKIYVTTTGVFTTAFATSNVNLLDSGHGHLNGQELTLSAATSIPKGLPVSSVCYVVNTATNDFEVALEPSGSSLIFIDNGSGTLTWSKTLLKALTTDYTVALVGTTATITWASGKAPGVGDKVLFLRDVTFQQTTDLQNNSQFEAESVESQLDLMVNMSQQLKNTTGRQLRFSTLLEASDASDAAATLTATASGRANKTLRFDSLGNLGVSTVNLENTQDNVLDAKSWATESPATVKEYDEAVGSAVSPAAYSAKEHAIGAPPDGSSKQWALGGGSFAVGTAVAGGVYSAKKYANDAAASADAAEGYTDAFDDRYLGSKSGSAPTVDNDGATLTDGALYFNTDSDHMFVYNLATTTWLDITIPSALDTTHFTASALVTQAEGIASNDNETTIPTSAAVKDYVDTTVTAQDLDFQGDSGGALNIDLDSEVLDIAGGTGITTTGSGNEVSVAHDAHTGDVTGATSLTIADDAVTYAKMQNVSATNMILGRDSASAGIIEEITPANLLTMLGIESSSTGDQSASEILTAIENSVDSVHYVDGSIDTIHIGDLQVTAAKVAADVATQAELDTVSVVASAAATTGKAIAMAIVFGG